jgi:thiol:disulfide interchange protein DsbD
MALVVAWSSLAPAQGNGFEDVLGLKPGRAPVPKPEFTVTLTPATAKAGDEVTLAVTVKLPEDFYIYSTTGEFDGRTKIDLTEAGLEAIDPDFVADHEPKTEFEPLFKVEVSKFHDRVTWKKRYRIPVDGDPAGVAVTGELTGQYCSSGEGGQCIPINPPFEFQAALVPPVRFAYEAPAKNSRLKYKLSPEDAKPGDKVTLSVTIELNNDWHTYSMKDMGGGSEPTVIALVSYQGLKPLGAGFRADHPPVVEKPAPDLTQEVYHGSVTWSQDLEVEAGAKPGEVGVRGTIHFQTCKKSCVNQRAAFTLGDVSNARWEAPKTEDVDIVAPPSSGKSDPIKPNVVKPGTATPKADGPAGIVPAAKKPQDAGLLAFLLTAVGFGLVSLLTPCVFPMVPITVSFFLKQSESEHHNPLLTAFVFCGSIVATFTVLGVGIAAIFGATQLNDLANNPWLNVAIGTVFVVFAFNMLGLFEIRIPSGLLNFTSNKERTGGYAGAMFMALTFTLTSFTCTFAFAGTLLVAAARGQYYWPIIGMLAFGTAFAAPFFMLAMVPSLLKKLPKSGGWMNAIKVVMGLIEIGAAVKFFSVADLVWNPKPMLFDFVFVMIAWLVLSLTIALYLLGVFRLSHDAGPVEISVFRLVVVMAFMGLGCNLAVGLVTHEAGGGWVMKQILAFAPPNFEKQNPDSRLPQPSITHHGLEFALDVDKAIAHATKVNRPMLYDFTGVNCTNCRLMEIKMAESHIHSRLEKFVLVKLYLDKVPTITDRAEAKRLKKQNNDLEIKLLGDVTMPAYAVMSPDGKTILSTYSGLERNEGEFAEFLDKGLKSWEESQSKTSAANHAGLQKFVPAQLYVDKVPAIPDPTEGKRLRERNVGLETEWLGHVVLPTYVVVTPDGKTVLSSYAGLEQNDGEYTAFLDDGWKEWKGMDGQ